MLPDLGEPELWLKIEILEDATYEPEDDEATEIVNMTESLEIPTSTESTSLEQAPRTGVTSNNECSEPAADATHKHTWLKIARKSLHLAVLGVGGWRDLHSGANR